MFFYILPKINTNNKWLISLKICKEFEQQKKTKKGGENVFCSLNYSFQ